MIPTSLYWPIIDMEVLFDDSFVDSETDPNSGQERQQAEDQAADSRCPHLPGFNRLDAGVANQRRGVAGLLELLRALLALVWAFGVHGFVDRRNPGRPVVRQGPRGEERFRPRQGGRTRLKERLRYAPRSRNPSIPCDRSRSISKRPE